jgi:hypothetical protein
MGLVLAYAAIISAYCYLGPERPKLVVSRLMAVFLVGVAIVSDMVFRHRGQVTREKGQPYGHWSLARLGLGMAIASRVVLLLVLPVSVPWPYWSPQTTAVAIGGLCIAGIGILLFLVAGVGMVRAEQKYGK